MYRVHKYLEKSVSITVRGYINPYTVLYLIKSLEGTQEMEIWDAYNSFFTKIEGKTLIRGETIPDGMFHLVVAVLVRHTDGSYLLMKRD